MTLGSCGYYRDIEEQHGMLALRAGQRLQGRFWGRIVAVRANRGPNWED